jgi:thioredoxin-related protein
MKIAFVLWMMWAGWGSDLSVAQQAAKDQHKLILLNFSGSDWCGPCIKLKKDVFESTEFQSFAEANLVLVRADFPRLKKNQLAKDQQAKNDALAERYNSDGKFPLTVLLNEQGKVLKEWDGYQPSTTKMLSEIQHFR